MKKQTDNGNKRGRDAGTGRFIPVSEAKRRPKTTIIKTRQPTSKTIEGHKGASKSLAGRMLHSPPKKGSLNLSLMRKSVAKIVESRKRAKVG
ncbi:MAG: hypothetical protein L0H12_03070 [Nitrosospira sp.]|nr:hypothetical protein [Nitrosospira sp.]MDN5881303.1 hypothetical protein [Nitrosospira sp.]MDN5935728.1 hypothetical protein [Nitrosospira sp.]